MEVDPSAVVTVPTSRTVDINQLEGGAACLELIEESKEKAANKEGSETAPALTQQTDDPPGEKLSEDKVEQLEISGTEEDKRELMDGRNKESGTEISEQVERSPDKNKIQDNEDSEKLLGESQLETTEPEVNKKGETVSEIRNEETEFENDRKVVLREAEKSEDVNKDDKKPVKKLKDKSLSLDSELLNDASEMSIRPMERRRSKIFETAEKFNQLAAATENDKPKKIFIPGVNVGGAKRAFERKASLSSITVPQTVKQSASKVIIEVPAVTKDDKAPEKNNEISNAENESKMEKYLQSKHEEEKKRAVDIITGAIGKPPMMKKTNGSPPTSPLNQGANKLGLKVQVGPNDLRNATVSVSTPVHTKFPFESKPTLQAEMVSYVGFSFSFLKTVC